MATATGIEITGETLRCVVLEGSVKAPRVKTAFQETIEPAVAQPHLTGPEGPEGEDSDRAEEQESSRAAVYGRRVGEILKEKDVPTGNVVLAVDGRQVYSREIVLPFTRAEQIQKTIKFEAEEFLPSTPVETMIIDYYKVAQVGGSGKKSRLLVCGVPKTMLSELLALCRAAELDPRMLDLDSACLANAGYAAGLFVPAATETVEKDEAGGGAATLEKALTGPLHTTSMILDLSRDIVRLALVEDDRLRRTRTFSLSIDPGKPSSQAIEKIVREIRRTQASCSLTAPASVIHVTGPACSARVEARLRSALRLDVERLRLEDVVDGEDDEKLRAVESAGSCALGAALKALSFDSIGLDFRKEEFAYQKLFDVLKTGLAAASVLVFFLAFMLAYTFNLRLSIDRNTLEAIRDNAKETFGKVLPGERLGRERDTLSILANLESGLKKRREGRISDKVPKIISALDIFRDFGEAVKRAGVRFKLKECTIKQTTVTIKGVVVKRDDIDRINSEITKASQYLIFVNMTDKLTTKNEFEVRNHYKLKKTR